MKDQDQMRRELASRLVSAVAEWQIADVHYRPSLHGTITDTIHAYMNPHIYEDYPGQAIEECRHPLVFVEQKRTSIPKAVSE